MTGTGPNRRGVVFGPQGPDGMSTLRGTVTPEGRAYLEAIGAAVRPGHHVPGAEQTVVDAASRYPDDVAAVP